MHLCKFCNQERKNQNSLRNHQRLCKNNPDRQFTPFQNLDFQRNKTENGGTNQFVKAKQLGLQAPTVSDETRRKISVSNTLRTKEWNRENGKKISKTVNEKVISENWHISLAKELHIDYNGINLHGTWELKYAQYLDANNIKWIRNKESFSYNFEGKNRKYTPDFYLPETNEYVEIKGYKTNKDDAKWNQFPKHLKLLILMRKELKRLGVKI